MQSRKGYLRWLKPLSWKNFQFIKDLPCFLDDTVRNEEYNEAGPF